MHVIHTFVNIVDNLQDILLLSFVSTGFVDNYVLAFSCLQSYPHIC